VSKSFFLNFFVVFSSVDNSEFMRNGDFLPTRLQAQQDAVGLIAQIKLRSNPESNVGLLTLSGMEGKSLKKTKKN
jgi:26S proteasome regulatory subunit N10